MYTLRINIHTLRHRICFFRSLVHQGPHVILQRFRNAPLGSKDMLTHIVTSIFDRNNSLLCRGFTCICIELRSEDRYQLSFFQFPSPLFRFQSR